MSIGHSPPASIPDLAVGVTVVDVPSHRSPALHQVALSAAAGADGPTIWIDARNNAASRLLHRPGARRRFANVRLARAFTAYQHHELVRTLPGEVSPETPLVVVPCVTSLYRDDDVPSPEDARYLRASMAVLAETATVCELPVLVSCVDGGELRDVVAEYATRTVAVDRTDLGYRYESDGFETTVYWTDGYWQTTIPYWVELLGTATEAFSVERAHADGLVAATV